MSVHFAPDSFCQTINHLHPSRPWPCLYRRQAPEYTCTINSENFCPVSQKMIYELVWLPSATWLLQSFIKELSADALCCLFFRVIAFVCHFNSFLSQEQFQRPLYFMSENCFLSSPCCISVFSCCQDSLVSGGRCRGDPCESWWIVFDVPRFPLCFLNEVPQINNGLRGFREFEVFSGVKGKAFACISAG